MDKQELLNQLTQVADSNKKRVDQYIKMTQSFLKDSPEWNQRHNEIFQEMVKEIQSSRRIKNFAYIAIAVLTILLLVVSTVSFIIHEKSESQQALIESARNAQLALRFTGVHESWLDVTVDPEAVSDPKIKSRMNTILKDFPALGRHYGLGRNKPLSLKRITRNKWLVLPESRDTTQIMGIFEIDENLGKLEFPEQRVELNEAIRYDEVKNFYVKVIEYKRRNPNIPDVVEWSVIFGEKPRNKPIIWLDESESIPINQSINGAIEKEPFVVNHPQWENYYIVTAGIGKLGAEPEEGQKYAWNLTSYVRSLHFN